MTNEINYDEFLKTALDSIAIEFEEKGLKVGFVTSRVSQEHWVQVEVGYILQKELYKRCYKNIQVFFESNKADIEIKNIESRSKVNIELKLLYGTNYLVGVIGDIIKKIIINSQQIDYLLLGIFVKNSHLCGNWNNYGENYKEALEKIEELLKNQTSVLSIKNDSKFSFTISEEKEKIENVLCIRGRGVFVGFEYEYTSKPFDFIFFHPEKEIKGRGIFVLFKLINKEKENVEKTADKIKELSEKNKKTQKEIKKEIKKEIEKLIEELKLKCLEEGKNLLKR